MMLMVEDMGEEEASSSSSGGTQLQDLPDAVVSTILSMVRDVRSRNSASASCRRFRALERATRERMTLRGSWRHLFLLPTCFAAVTHLDLSLLSPWGSNPVPSLAPLSLPRAFPHVTTLSVYSRDPSLLLPLLPRLPLLRHLRLLRWHPRPPSQPGQELLPVLVQCPLLSSLDLSSFYHWPEDLPSALQLLPAPTRLASLDLLSDSSPDGCKSPDLLSIARFCPLLRTLRLPCVLDPRFDDAVSDRTLLALAHACPGLRTLVLLDRRAGGDDDATESHVTAAGLEAMFDRLPELEEFELDSGHVLRDCGPALEALKGRRMRAVRAGGLQGICRASALHLDGVAAIGSLRELAIRDCADLSDAGLAMIGRGCSRLEKFELVGCKGVTPAGLRRMLSSLRSTLVDVKISSCENFDCVKAIQALEPVRDCLESLHIDCVWSSDDDKGKDVGGFECDPDGEPEEFEDPEGGRRKRSRFAPDCDADMGMDLGLFWCRTWNKLRRLSVWVPVGELLTPLAAAGLESCPELEEMNIKVEGDCRSCPKPSSPFFGLCSLLHYPTLMKMRLDLSNVIGYVLTAPMGLMDLSLWERFYLKGIEELQGLEELHYWPPQDRDVNQRSLSLPAAGLLSECAGLRRLFIHGTLHEHFMRFLLNIPNLRDVQLLEDYYPAPENDTSTEMRVDSCIRFEEALNRRMIPD